MSDASADPHQPDVANRRAWLRLLRAPGLGPSNLRALIAHFGSAAGAVAAGRAAWTRAGLSREAATGLAGIDDAVVAADLDWLAAAPDRHLVTCEDPRYPPRLAAVDTAPAALFCIGDPALLALPQVAVVGARQASPQGVDNAESFAAALVARGLVVTSGLALGIDGAAHRGALSAAGNTIAVCATGLDRVYPARHKQLAHSVAERGLLVSEFSPGMPPLAENFPRRNRIIAGLSLGVLVVEAARESGSLITARLATEQGREVFAIPGSIHNPMARGCHQLLRQGAKLVESVDDIIEELAGAIAGVLAEAGATRQAPESSRPAHDLLAIWQALGDEPASLDVLAGRLQATPESLSEPLLRLELEGWVGNDGAGRLMRRHRVPASGA